MVRSFTQHHEEELTDELVQAALIGQMEWNVRQVLAHDTSAISTYRCLKLFFERLGCNFSVQVGVRLKIEALRHDIVAYLSACLYMC